MIRLRALPALLLLFFPVSTLAAGLKILPGEVRLTGPHASQRLLVVREQDGEATADLSASARLTTSSARVAAVDPGGVIRATGDGEATITATVGKDSATVKVKVAEFQAPFTW